MGKKGLSSAFLDNCTSATKLRCLIRLKKTTKEYMTKIEIDQFNENFVCRDILKKLVNTIDFTDPLLLYNRNISGRKMQFWFSKS